jgi:hypothetical protein
VPDDAALVRGAARFIASVEAGLRARPEGRGILEAILAILLQRPGEHGVQRRGDGRSERAGDRRGFTHMLVRDGHRAVTDEGRSSGQQLEQEATGRIQVAAGIDRLTASLFGREVLGCAQDRLGLRHRSLRIGHGPGDPEIHDLDPAVRRDHHVGGFDVPVDDAGLVAVPERAEDAGHIGDAVLRGQVAGLHVVAEGSALDVFHDDEGNAHLVLWPVRDLLLAGVVDRDDVRVVESGNGLRLAAEP